VKKAMIYILATMLLLTAIPYASASSEKTDSVGMMDRTNGLNSVSVLAGNGDYDEWDGAALKASFRMPQGITVLKDGSVLIADSNNHLIRQIAKGQVSTYAGIMLDADANGMTNGGWHDGTQQTAVFNTPSGMDTDSEGNVYIADAENHAIRKISKSGIVSTIAGDGILGHKDGAGSGARFYRPEDVAVAADGTLYVADSLNHSIRRIAPNGQVTTLNAPSNRVIEVTAGYAVLAGDFADGKLSESKFNAPTSIAIDSKGNLYVSDTGNHVIRYIDLAKGTVTTVAGLSHGKKPVYQQGALYAEGGYADGSSSEARFYSPRGIALTKEQGLLIADSLNHTIRYLIDGQVSTVAGVPAQFGQVDGINGHNLLHHPTDVAVLQNGNLIIADSYNNQIRELKWYTLPGDLPENDQLKVVFENQLIQFDAQPEIVQGRTMIPVRGLSERMGYKVKFDNNTIELTKGDLSAHLQVGSRVMATKKAATDVQEQQEMEAATYTKDGRTYVPLRFFSEAFGADVAWDQNAKTVILREIAVAIDKGPLADRHAREATLDQIKGAVWISQAGGSLTYRAYNGMKLHHGDRIITEVKSSANLKTVDRKDELTISENSELYIANLTNASQVKHTSLVLWSGMIWASVTPLLDTKDTFNVMTPSAMMNVRGTQLLVSIDQFTGALRLAVNSGVVQAGGRGTAEEQGYVYPSQQITIFGERDGIDAIEPIYSIIDISDLVNQASPAIILALIKDKSKIDHENNEMIERMKERMKNGGSDVNPGDNPYNQPLEQVRNNLDNLIGNIAKEALNQQKLTRDELKKIIEEVNKNSNNEIDLNNVPPLHLTEQQRQEQDKLQQWMAESKRQKEEQKKPSERPEVLQDALNKISAEKQRQVQENIRQQEEATKRAAELLRQQLSDAERKRFDQQQQELERQRQQQEAALRPVLLIPIEPAPSIPILPKAAMPLSNIGSGSVELNTEIELTTSTSGAAIYYTTDGSTPSVSNGTLYTEPVVITQDTTIKAIAIKSKYTSSEILTLSYTIIVPEEERPEFAEGYPKTYAKTENETTNVNVIVKTDKSGMIFFVVVPRNEAAPTAEEILADFHAEERNPKWLAYSYADIAADREFHYQVELKKQVSEYDVYVITVIGFDGAISKVGKATAISPPIIDEPEEVQQP